MIDFDDLDRADTALVGRVVDSDANDIPRGECDCCDCLEFQAAEEVEWVPHAYNSLEFTANSTDGVGASLAAGLGAQTGAGGAAQGFCQSACSRCGCDASAHECLSGLVSHFWEQGGLVEVEPDWSKIERALYRQTRGVFSPQLRSRSRHGAPVGGGGAQPLVSVICPTGAGRRQFHPFLYRCFCHQTCEAAELIVIDTGHATQPSPFFADGPPAGDPRVTYLFFDVKDGQPWTIGAKRNLACYLARGRVVVHFDDDDIYAPAYVATVLQALQLGSACPEAAVEVRVVEDRSPWDPNTPLRREAFAAEAATFSQWYTFNLRQTAVRVCDVDNDHGGSRAWTFGYGFSFAYLRDVWSSYWFREVDLGEDCDFLEGALARGARVALLRDNVGLCAHTHHGTNFSPWEKDRSVPPSSAALSGVLAALGAELSGMVTNVDGALMALGAVNGQALTKRSCAAMQLELVLALADSGFQERLHSAWWAVAGDPARQVEERRRLALQVQGPVIARFGFAQDFEGVLRSTAAFNVLFEEELRCPGNNIAVLAYAMRWLSNPGTQYDEPMPEGLRRHITGILVKSLGARRRRRKRRDDEDIKQRAKAPVRPEP